MEPLISIIIPVYNIKEFLPLCLNNITKQTYSNIEILIVDDGSTDGTAAVCDEYADNDQRIKVIHKENEGQSVARNMAIKVAKGEYIAFIDGDDWVREDYIRLLYNLAIKYDAEIVNCNFVRTDKFGQIDKNVGSLQEVEFSSESAIENLCYIKELNCAPYSKLFKKEIWSTIEFPIGCIYEDLATIYKTYDAANKIIYIDYNGYFYFQRRGSSLNTDFSEKKLSRVDFSEDIVTFVKEKYPAIINAAYCRLFWSASGALMDIPIGYKEKGRVDQIRRDIKEARKKLLHDNKCKRVINCLVKLSYSGLVPYQIILKIYRTLGK